MLLITDCVKRFSIEVLSDVSIVEINAPMIGACYAYDRLCAEYGVRGVMTGAARDKVYAKEPLHLKGFAWDFRSYIFNDVPKAFARFVELLKAVSPYYRAVNIKPPKPIHFHVEWRGPTK